MSDMSSADRTPAGQTPSQTVGPYFAYGLVGDQYGYDFASIATGMIASDDEPGTHIRVVGRVFDGAGAAIEDALIEIWQADAAGRYPQRASAGTAPRAFRGFGRVGTGTDPDRRFVFDTIKPGSVDGVQAPHLNVIVLMRGLLVHVFTRIYFPDEAAANAVDPILATVPIDRRHTLVADRVAHAAMPTYRFDIRMQGADETVFFDA